MKKSGTNDINWEDSNTNETEAYTGILPNLYGIGRFV